jgi:hypothetical protein
VGVFVFVVSGVFVLLGVIALAAGKDPLAGCTVVCFFGGCWAIAAWELFGRNGAGTTSPAWRVALPHRRRLALRGSCGQGIAYLCGAAGFVAAGVWLVVSGKAPALGWCAVICFGLGALVFLRRLLDVRPRLVLNSRGVYDRNLRAGRIPWQDIAAVWRLSVHDNEFLALELRAPEKYLRRLSRWRRWLARANRRWGFPEFYLHLSGLALNSDEVARLITLHLDNARGAAER